MKNSHNTQHTTHILKRSYKYIVFVCALILCNTQCDKSAINLSKQRDKATYEKANSFTPQLISRANANFLEMKGLKNFHKTSNEDKTNDNLKNLYYDKEMNNYVSQSLQKNKMIVEIFDTSKYIYQSCKNNLIERSQKTPFKNYDEYDDFVLEQMNLTEKVIEKNTLATYLSMFKSGALFFDKNENNIVIASDIIKWRNNNESVTNRFQNFRDNTFIIHRIAKHTVVGKILTATADVFYTAYVFARTFVEPCIETFEDATISIRLITLPICMTGGVVLGAVGFVYGIYKNINEA